MKSRAIILAVSAVSVVLAGVVGCDNTPPPPRVPVPAMGQPGPDRYDPVKPLPGQGAQLPQPIPSQSQVPMLPSPPSPVAPPPSPIPPSSYVPAPQPPIAYQPRAKLLAAPPAEQLNLPQQAPAGYYNDTPLVKDRPPEQRAFVEAYNRVGRPKIAIYVNRGLDGVTVPVNNREPILSAQSNTSISGPVTVTHNTGVFGSTSVQTNGPVSASSNSALYVAPGEYDDLQARALDYEAIENILTDWMAAGGQTSIISPTLARAKLTADQQKALDGGQAFVLTDITQRLDADILIQVQVRPTKQANYNAPGQAAVYQARLIAEAINLRGGQSVARAVVDVPPPLDKQTMNEYTRFVARKLMDDMIYTWSAQPPTPPAAMQPAIPAVQAVPAK